MSEVSARLALPYLVPSQAQKHVTHNEALARLDMLVQMVVEAFDAQTPAPAPQEGQVWALGAAPTGAWSGEADRLAVWQNGGWVFVTPAEGWRAWDRGGAALRVRQATGWEVAGSTGGSTPASLQDMDSIGINAVADGTNRLSVSAAATLLSHDGAGHELTLNRAGAADDAALAFKTGYSARALMGLLASDNLALKVSPDGVSYLTALEIDAATGHVSAPLKPRFSAFTYGSWLDITTPDTDLGFTTVTSNTGGHFDPVTGTFTAPVSGLYVFVLNGLLDATTNGRIALSKNGVTQTGQMLVLVGNVPLSFTMAMELAAGDTVTCRTGNINAKLRYFRSSTVFSGWLA